MILLHVYLQRQLSVKDKEIEDLRSAVETKDLELVLKNDIEVQYTVEITLYLCTKSPPS